MTGAEVELLKKISEIPARESTLNDPVTYLIIFGLLSATGLVVNIIFNRIKKNESDLEAEKERTTNALRRLEEKLFESTVHKNDCSGKQDLWAERFDNIMERFGDYITQNEKEHSNVIDVMQKSAKASAAQIADFAEKIEDLAECVKNLELGKEC